MARLLLESLGDGSIAITLNPEPTVSYTSSIRDASEIDAHVFVAEFKRLSVVAQPVTTMLNQREAERMQAGREGDGVVQ